MPLPLGSQAHGTAVMVTFTHLNDMIDRLLKYHRVIGTQSSCYDEWKPVEFLSVNMANLNDATPDSESQSTNLTTAVPTILQDEAPRNDFSLSAPEINTLVADLSDDTAQEVCTNNMETEPEPSRQVCLNSVTSTDAPESESDLSAPMVNTVASYNFSPDIFHKLSKLSKQERKKYKRRLMHSDRISQRKENQQRREKEKYASDETYRAKKREYVIKQYQTNSELQQKKKNKINNPIQRKF